MSESYFFSTTPQAPVVIAGPCMAESPTLLSEVVSPLKQLAKELKFEFIFKASFDKANRTSIHSYRGPGLDQAMKWFADLKSQHGCAVLTDVHESSQCQAVAEVCDVLQIPAFLCRQTDLIIEAVKTGKAVNVKKGQFVGPEGIAHIANKLIESSKEFQLPVNFALTERGTSFGYGNLVVDMRNFKAMHQTKAAVIFDVTHSLQLPGQANADGSSSGGAREFAPILTRSAIATGLLSGLFLEVHPEPSKARSDATTQLSIKQAETLLRQVIPMWYAHRNSAQEDHLFT